MSRPIVYPDTSRPSTATGNGEAEILTDLFRLVIASCMTISIAEYLTALLPFFLAIPPAPYPKLGSS